MLDHGEVRGRALGSAGIREASGGRTGARVHHFPAPEESKVVGVQRDLCPEATGEF